MRSAGAGGGRHGQGRIHQPSLPFSPASSAALLTLYTLLISKWTCTRVCKRMVIRTEAKGLPPGLHHRRCGCWGLVSSTALRGAVTVAASVAICARMFYDTFVFNFGFYLLWWCLYYQWCLYFYEKDFMVMYSCIFTYECVFYYVLGQRWPNKQVKSIMLTIGWWRIVDNIL